MHILEKDLGGITLLACLLLETFDGTVDGGDCVPNVGEVLNLALENWIPRKITPHLLELVWIGGIVEEFLDANGTDGDVGERGGARERRHV